MLRLTSLNLLNFRCFKRFHLNLDPQCTVLVGDNGSGKTAALDGLAVALGAWLLGFNDAPSRPILDDEIRRAQFEQQGQVFLEPSYPVEVTACGIAADPSLTSWTRSLNQQGGRTTSRQAAHIKRSAAVYQHLVSDGQPVTLPLIAYYGAGRLWVQKRENSAKESALGSRLQGYVDCLDPASNHKLLTAWMRQQAYAHLQAISRAAHPQYPTAHPLRVIGACIARVIEGAEDIFFSIPHDTLMIRMTDQRLLPFHMLSDGYRNLIAMTADIAWRALQLNPHDSHRLDHTQGVVLIDEIDLHLHPKWQRSVLHQLIDIFPRIQWVVTTHSPQVLSSAQRSWVRVLNGGPTAHTISRHVEGRDSNAILEDIMDVPERPQHVKDRITYLFQLIDGNDHATAYQTLQELSLILGPDDTALVRASWMLEMDAADA
jgi:predicted ATP-binding protein involved in virulence